ncbi:MAG TPA: hypothetical protein VFV72_10840 [Candidatus Limnocylindrales bacterium]|nr:hypothetical protein [Candidatus Limnocylindrales bacterium]
MLSRVRHRGFVVAFALFVGVAAACTPGGGGGGGGTTTTPAPVAPSVPAGSGAPGRYGDY